MKKIVNLDDVTARLLKVFNDSKGNMSNNDFAQKLDLQPATLSNYQLGRLPQLEQLIKIRNNLELPFGYLLGEIDVLNYADDTENTFGLTKDCIRKIETLNNNELEILSTFIVNCSNELLDLLYEYSKLPSLPQNNNIYGILPNEQKVPPSEITKFIIEDDYIRKNIITHFNTLINNVKPQFDSETSMFSKKGKEIRSNLTTKITNNNIFKQ